MAGARIEIRLEDAEVRARLTELIARGGDLSPALREIGEVMLASTRQRFSTQTDPSGAPWARNTPTTASRKTNPRVMTESGMLGDQIRYQLKDTGRTVEVGSNRVYAAMMQFGGTKSRWPHLWGDIPARSFLGTSTEDRSRILEILRDWLVRSA